MLLFVLCLVLLPYTRVFQTVVRDDSTGGPWRYDEKLKSYIYVLHSTYPVEDNCPSYLQLEGFRIIFHPVSHILLVLNKKFNEIRFYLFFALDWGSPKNRFVNSGPCPKNVRKTLPCFMLMLNFFSN